MLVGIADLEERPKPHEQRHAGDPLRPARGVVFGVLIGMAIWLLIIGAWLLFRLL